MCPYSFVGNVWLTRKPGLPSSRPCIDYIYSQRVTLNPSRSHLGAWRFISEMHINKTSQFSSSWLNLTQGVSKVYQKVGREDDWGIHSAFLGHRWLSFSNKILQPLPGSLFPWLYICLNAANILFLVA